MYFNYRIKSQEPRAKMLVALRALFGFAVIKLVALCALVGFAVIDFIDLIDFICASRIKTTQSK
jgi:hypothetical protein